VAFLGGGGGGGGGDAEDPPESLTLGRAPPAPLGPFVPPTQGPVTPPYELPAAALFTVVPQNTGKQKPAVLSAREVVQTVLPEQGAPADEHRDVSIASTSHMQC